MTNKVTQLGVLFACVLGFVVLSVRGEDTTSFVTFVGPVFAGVFVTAHVSSRSDAQDAVLAKISHQTNGVLTERIQTAVANALDEREADPTEPGPRPFDQWASPDENPAIVKGAD